jgi:hypothetical protein
MSLMRPGNFLCHCEERSDRRAKPGGMLAISIAVNNGMGIASLLPQ